MPNLNKVMLMGNLTRDPEMRYTSSNMPVVRFSIAVNRRWRNQSGEQQKETMFIDCAAFAKTAELINQYFHKGKPIFVEGRLKLDRWEDKDGNKRSKHEIIVEQFEFLEARGDSDGGGGDQRGGNQGGNQDGSRGGGRSSAPQDAAPQDSAPDQDYHQPVEEEDIPF